MIGTGAVTFQTALIDVFGSRFLKGEDFALVTTTVNVLGAGTMTGFATMGFGSVFSLQEIVPVAGLLKIIKYILVAGLAGVCSDILRHFGGRGSGRCRGARLNALTCGWRTGLAGSKGDDEKKKDEQKSWKSCEI